MISKSNYTLVGAFVLILGAAFIWGVLWISAGGPPQRFGYYVVYMTESVSGLNVDSPLRFRGVDVGKVENIRIDLNDPQRIRLLLQVSQGTPINAETVAMLEYQGLTGLANINLIGGRVDAPPLMVAPGEEYPVIPSRPSLFARLDATMSDLLGNLIQTSAGLNGLLTEANNANVSRSIENITVLTDNVAQQSERLNTIFADLGVTLGNTRTASDEFPQLVQQLSETAEAITRMAGVYESTGVNLQAVSSALKDTASVSGENVSDFTSTTLPEISAMVSELRRAAENLRRVSESLAQDPSVLVYGSRAPSPGPGE